uniref:Uncharacterized protein n=1 Tax=Triticum urartu TaxID=4572 RepID=A0A8R7PNH9_TRIUA
MQAPRSQVTTASHRPTQARSYVHRTPQFVESHPREPIEQIIRAATYRTYVCTLLTRRHRSTSQSARAGLADLDDHGRLGHGHGGNGDAGPGHGDGELRAAVVHGSPDLAQGGVVGEVEPAEEGGDAALDVVARLALGLPPQVPLAGDDQHLALLLHLHLDLLLGDARGEPGAEDVGLRRLPALDVGVGERRGVAGQPGVGAAGRRGAEDAAEGVPRVQGQRVEEPHQRHPLDRFS